MELVRMVISHSRFSPQIVLLLLILTPAPAWVLEDKIVFVSKRNFTPEVFLVERLNGRPIQITRNMFASWPSMSPDGTDVVFVSRPPGGISNIFKLHIPSRRMEKLTDDAERDTRYTDLDWSPDGRQILFIEALLIPNPLNREKTALCVMDMKTREIRHIVQPDLPTEIRNPSWSPDSQHILYLHIREHREHSGLGISTLFITDDNGNNLVEVRRDDQDVLPDLSAVVVPTWSPSRSRIAYIGSIVNRRLSPPNPLQIYAMNLNDGNVTALTSGGTKERFLSEWRPDGRKILFALASSFYPNLAPSSEEIKSSDIYVMDADAENMINLTQSPELEYKASWSPDGKHIVFDKKIGDAQWAIFVMDANGQNLQRLTFEPGFNVSPHWSPDGERIAFVSTRDGSRRIYTMGTDGQNVQQITHRQHEFYGAPTWSPDAKWLAFGAGNFRKWGIYLTDPQGRNERLIFRSNVSQLDTRTAGGPTWSPDGQHLVFVEPWDEANLGLIRIRVDGAMPTALNTGDLTRWRAPKWSPDGNSILFSAREKRGPFVKSDPIVINDEREVAIFLMNLDTSESRHFILPGISELIFESGFQPLRLVWAPDGSQLMLSIGQTRIANQGERRLYLIDIVSETVRLWLDDAAEVDWVRPGFEYAVNPREKRIATWAQIKKGRDIDAKVIP